MARGERAALAQLFEEEKLRREPAATSLMHNHDERISLANLRFALHTEFALVARLMSGK